MLVWWAAGLLLGAVVVAARWATARRDGLGRARPFPAVTVALLGLLGAGLLVPVVRHHRLEGQLGGVASTLVGVRVAVHCQTAGEELVDVGAELGYVRYGRDGVPEHRAVLKRGPCRALASYLRSDHVRPSRDEVVAVHVLSHESRHLAGTRDEASAECEAIQRDAWAARLLGASDDDALALARTYWREIYPRMTEDYVTVDCAPGRRLDEGRVDAPWSVP